MALLLLKEQKERRVDSSIRCCVVEVQEENTGKCLLHLATRRSLLGSFKGMVETEGGSGRGKVGEEMV